jgi:outer membrane protein assembly factor BamB
MRVDRRLTSLVEDARGELIGAVAVDGSARAISFVPTAGRGGWTTALRDPTRGPLSGDGSAALLDGDRIVVAPFDTAGEGMQLYALDRATGRLLWRGEVDQFNYPHSVYLHDVRLAARGDRIVLESVEAAGCSLQLFEPATGKRMFVSTVDQWARRK